MLGRIDIQLVKFAQDLTGQRVEPGDFLNFVPKKTNPKSFAFAIGGQNFQCIAPHPEDARFDLEVIALILNIYQLP